MVTCIRQKTSSLLLVAGILALTAGPLFAATTHQVCDAMGHGCAKLQAGCCCSDRSEASPSRTPVRTADAIALLPAFVVPIAILPGPAAGVVVTFIGRPATLPSHDLRILFSDLRL